MTNEKTMEETFIEILNQRKKEQDERFNELKKLCEKLKQSEDQASEKHIGMILGYLIHELENMNSGISGSFEFIGRLLDDRNQIAKWIKQYKEDREFLDEILGVITDRIDEFVEFMKENNNISKDINVIKNNQEEVISLKDQLIDYAKKIKEREQIKLEDRKDLPYIG